MSTPEPPDVDPAGIMSLTEYDIAVGKALAACSACREKRQHTEAEYGLHPGEVRQRIEVYFSTRETQNTSEKENESPHPNTIS